MDAVTKRKLMPNEKSVKAFNFFSQKEKLILLAILSGENHIRGFNNGIFLTLCCIFEKNHRHDKIIL